MSSVGLLTFNDVSLLMGQFQQYDDIFIPVFFQYNGDTQNITLQYRLRTYNNALSEDEFLGGLITQFIQNPIQIPSNLYTVQIYSQNSRQNLAKNPDYFQKIGSMNLFDISKLLEIESEFVTIIIDSNFKMSFDHLISAHISKQPKPMEKNIMMYETISMLKTNDFPDKFQCFNIPIEFKLVLNDFVEFFIPKKILMAFSRWYDLEMKSSKALYHNKNVFSNMIQNKYNITPLVFGKKLDAVLNEILAYIQENHESIFEIQNIQGTLEPQIPRGYHLAEKTSIIEIQLRFKTNFDNTSVGTKSMILFSFGWMHKIFKKYFPESNHPK